MNTSKIKRIIFDIDNTLICNVHFLEAIQKTLTDLSIYSDENVNHFLEAISNYEKKYKSYKKEDYIEFFSHSLHIPLDEKFLTLFFHYLKDTIPIKCEVEKETLDYLSQKYELVLLSNYFEESQRNRLKAMGINSYFSEYYGEQCIKPYKESYLMACKNHLPYECVLVGDHPILDSKVPKSLGIHTILLADNKNDEADYIIENIKELKRIL